MVSSVARITTYARDGVLVDRDPAAQLVVRMPPRQPNSLPDFSTRHPLVIGVERRSFNVTVEVLDIVAPPRPVLGSAARPRGLPGRTSSAASLEPNSSRSAGLVKREGQVVVPRRGRDDQPESPVLVNDVAGTQFGRAETAQEVLELVDGLDRRRQIV